MSLFKKTRNGKEYGRWQYRFKHLGKTYKGTTGTNIYQEAKLFEENVRNAIGASINNKVGIQNDSIQRLETNLRLHIQGESIVLSKVWEKFKELAPAKTEKSISEIQWKRKRAYWDDFCAFLEHEEVKTLRDVTSDMAERYTSLLKTEGKYNKTISRTTSGAYKTKTTALSGRTTGKYITQIRQVFTVLEKSAHLTQNPFDGVKKPKAQKGKREAFEIDEIKKISAFIDSGAVLPLSRSPKVDHTILEAIFVIGLNTGLRRADICLLKWESVSFSRGALAIASTAKTGTAVFIPFSKALLAFLRKKKESAKGCYVVPELAEIFLNDHNKITVKFKALLSELGIKSQKEVEGRSRKLSIKDIHSLRHTFCYLHGLKGTDIGLVQSMVGHMDSELTEQYSRHETEEKKRIAIAEVSGTFLWEGDDGEDDIKAEARKLLNSCVDFEKLQAVLRILKSEQLSGQNV